MDDPRLLQFFVDPQLPQQRRYEAIRAVVTQSQSLQAAAARFGFAYGTLRNLVTQFRACIRQGRTPPFLSPPRADGPPRVRPSHARIVRRRPIADGSPWIGLIPFAHASPDSSCFCPCSRSSASIVLSTLPAIPAHA